MSAIVSLLIVVVLFLIAFLGAKAAGLQFLFGVVLPYMAFALFVGGVVWRIIRWAKAPVPFRVPTTAGQQKTINGFKHAKFDNPFCWMGVVGRMAMEIFLFRSLFRNTKVELTDDQKVAYGPEKVLWLAGLAFHWTFLVILLRHMRFFMEPVPGLINGIQYLDGFFQIATPTFFMSSLIFLAAITALFVRRVVIPQVRYISFAADYFPLFLINK